ncbi:hypothetical protein GCM10020256_73060 [Streptomyces thermocoprophilus]
MIDMTGITGLLNKTDAFVVIRDSDLVVAALRQALTDAPDAQREGLERALAVVEETAAASAGEVRARWVRSRLAEVGFTGDIASVSAVKALRKAEPRLSLLAAVQLQKEAVARLE